MKPRSLGKEIAILVVIAAFLGIVFNAFSPRGIPLVRTEPPKEGVTDSTLFGQVRSDADAQRQGTAVAESTAAQGGGSYRTISLEQFKRLVAARRGLLLDARSEEDYVKGHVPGAKSVPGQNPDPSFEHLAQLPRDTLVVVYCNNPECHLGRMLIDFMKVLGYTNMVLFDDGWDGWLAAHQAIDSTAAGW